VTQIILKIGDALELMQKNERIFDLILTDPPFFISTEIVITRSRHQQYKGPDIKLDFGRWDHFPDEASYWAFTREWVLRAVSCLRVGGHLVTFFPLNRAAHLIDFASSLDLRYRQPLFWLKSNPTPRARKVDFMLALEPALWFTKGDTSKATFNYQLGQQTNFVKSAVPHGAHRHPTEKPVAVLEVWIKYLSRENDWVLDPFAGSGSTGEACLRTQRNCVMFEIDERWRRRIEERCKMHYARFNSI